MTLSDLAASIRFRALFEFTFGEAAYRQYRALDVVLLADPEITFTGHDAGTLTGRFICQAEILAEVHGTANGTFQLTLPDGLGSDDPDTVLDNAELDMVIEAAPFASHVSQRA